MQFELVKIVCVAIVSQREGDKIVGEIESPRVACYDEGQLVAYRKNALAEIAAKNAEEAAAVPNRRARRARKAPAKSSRKR